MLPGTIQPIKVVNNSSANPHSEVKIVGDSKDELEFFNGLLASVLPSGKKFSFNEKTQSNPYESYRLTLSMTYFYLLEELAKALSGFGVKAERQSKNGFPICIVDCSTVKLLREINSSKISTALENAKKVAYFYNQGVEFENTNNQSLSVALQCYQEALKLGCEKAAKDVERIQRKIASNTNSGAVASMANRGFGANFSGSNQAQEENEQPDALPMVVTTVQPK